MDAITDYWLRFGVNLAIISLLIAGLYWRRKPNSNNALAMIVGGTLVYAVIRLLVQFEISLGVGFGIFAVFSLATFSHGGAFVARHDLPFRHTSPCHSSTPC